MTNLNKLFKTLNSLDYVHDDVSFMTTVPADDFTNLQDVLEEHNCGVVKEGHWTDKDGVDMLDVSVWFNTEEENIG